MKKRIIEAGLAAKYRDLISQLGMSQADAAALLSIDRVTLNRRLNNRAPLNAEHVLAVQQILADRNAVKTAVEDIL